MALETTGRALHFLACYRCEPATFQVAETVEHEGWRCYFHQCPSEQIFHEAKGMRDEGASVGDVLAFLALAWEHHDADAG
jgi:hypothetical protein